LRIMETIRMATWIDAPVERCFLLSLSIDLHVASAHGSQEKAIGGVMSGLIGEGETVTFQARHFGWRRHTSRIEVLRPYSHFRDVMVAGSFRRFEHDHHFATMDDGTRVRDEVRFVAPWGPLGQVLARRRLKDLFRERNAVLKRVAESEEWRKYLDMGVVGRVAARWAPPERGWKSLGLLRGGEIALPRVPRLDKV
jgi:ligand-binding SRPBCC domain-containing protein